MSEADAGMKAAQRRQDVEEESESGVDAWGMPEIGGGLEQIGKAAPGNELGHDSGSTRVALHGPWARQTLVFEAAEPLDAVAEGPFEGRELGTEHEASSVTPSSQSNARTRRPKPSAKPDEVVDDAWYRQR